jgi:hypothetical protein
MIFFDIATTPFIPPQTFIYGTAGRRNEREGRKRTQKEEKGAGGEDCEMETERWGRKGRDAESGERKVSERRTAC